MASSNLLLVFVVSSIFVVDASVRLATGVYSSTQPHLIPFETLIPVHFEVPLAELPIASPPPECEGSSNVDVQQACTLAKSVYGAYAKLTNSFGKYFPYGNYESFKTSRSVLPFLGSGMKWLYGVASEDDLKGIYTNLENVQKSQLTMKNQVSADHRTLLDLTRQSNVYAKDLGSFLRNVSDAIKSTVNARYRTKQIEALLTYSIHNNFLVNYVDHFQGVLLSAGSDCRENFIPVSLLPKEALETKIQEVVAKSLIEGYTTSVAIGNLIQLPIALCKFTEKSLTITVNLPMRRADLKYSFRHLISVPFQHNEKQCEYKIPNLIGIRGDENIPLKDISADTRLVHLPPFPETDFHLSDCLSMLLNPKTASDLSICPMVCKESSNLVIKQVEVDRYIITNSDKIILKCSNGTEKEMKNDGKIGFIQLDMPCKCSAIVYSGLNNSTISPPFPCRASKFETSTTLVPLAWSKLRSMDFNNGTMSLSNSSDIFDAEWASHIPTIHVEEPKLVPEWNNPINYLKWASTPDYLWIWNSLLTIGLVFMLFKTFWGCSSFNYMAIPALFSKANGANAQSQNGTLLTAMYNMEWSTIIFLVISIVLVLMLFFIVYRILRVVRTTARFLENNFLIKDMEEELRPRNRRR